MTEAQFMKRICDLCDWLGLRYWHDQDSRRNAAGWPDLVIVGNSVIYAELKTERGRVSPEQHAWHDDLKRADAEVYIWRPSDWDFIADRLAALAGRPLINARGINA